MNGRQIKIHIIASAAALLMAGCASGGEAPAVTAQTTASSVSTTTTTAQTAAPETETTTAAAAAIAASSTKPETETAPATESIPSMTAAVQEPDANAEVYAKAKHINGLRYDPTDTDGVYEIKGLAEELPDMEFHNGIALVFGYIKGSEKEYEYDGRYGNCTIRVYDIDRGLLLGETDSRSTGYYCYNDELCGAFDGGFYSCEGNKARLFDIGMNVTAEFTLPARKCTRIWVSSNGRYILSNEKGSPTRLYDTREKRETELSQRVKAASVLARGEDYFDIIDKKDRRFRITAAGEVTSLGTMPVPDYYRDTFDLLEGKVLDLVPAGLCLRDPCSSSARLLEYDPLKVQYVLCADDRYITISDENDDTRVFDMERGRISEPLGHGAFSAGVNAHDSSFVFFDGSTDGKQRYLLAVPSEMKYKKKVTVKQLDLEKEEYTIFFNKVQPNSERAVLLLDELLERYNVRVLFSPVSESSKYFGYYCKPYRGDQAAVLEKLRDFLALSPPGILTEAAEGGSETWVLICSDIVDAPELTSYGTAAFAATVGLHPFVALETPMNEEEAKKTKEYTGRELDEYFAKYITDNFSHEFIHILDAKTTPIQTEQWEALSPEDCYFGTYDKMNGTGSDKYIYFGRDFDDSVYFTDKYARINSLEDKARVGEYLYYAGSDNKLSALEKFARSRSLYKKGKALSRILRENFHCLASVPEGEWYLEKPLSAGYKALKKKWKEEQDTGGGYITAAR